MGGDDDAFGPRVFYRWRIFYSEQKERKRAEYVFFGRELSSERISVVVRFPDTRRSTIRISDEVDRMSYKGRRETAGNFTSTRHAVLYLRDGRSE